MKTTEKITNNVINFFENQLKILPNILYFGSVIESKGLILSVSGLNLPIGSICFIKSRVKNYFLRKKCEVVGFKKNIIFVMPLDGKIDGVSSGDQVIPCIINGSKSKYLEKQIPLGDFLLSRVLNSVGHPIDNIKVFNPDAYDSLFTTFTNPMYRKPINKILDVGIRSINSLFTIGQGQRIGLFSTSGVGKSILLGMITKYSQSDIVVIGLIGERGREIRQFVDEILGQEGMSKSVVIAEPANSSPLLKIQGALYATRIAEYFREQGKKVLLIIDSLTRYAMSLREIALSLGELPVAKGYPVSVFSKLSTLLERAGNSSSSSGSISAIYTILTEEDELNDPISEVVKSVLDGHLVLSKDLAKSGKYPAIDIERSISRVMSHLVSSKKYSRMLYFKKLFSAYEKNKDLINVGAYISGTDMIIDQAIIMKEKLDKFLQQTMLERVDYYHSNIELKNLFNNIKI